MSLDNHLLLRAIRKEPVERTPVWIMRQAGRYLPEYIKLKNQAGGFMNLIKNPELACEITLQPLDRFNLDSAIIFSDILVITELFGIELEFIEKVGPVLSKTLRTEDDLKKINTDFDFEKVDYVYKTAKLLKNELNNKVPLIGFIGSPWTVATYIIEGNSTKNFSKVLNILKNDKIFLKSLLDMITKASINHLERQIKSGVDVTMIFDTWGGLLEGDLYEEFSLQYINTIHSSLKSYKKPMIYYIRNPYTKLVNIQKLDVDVVGIDSSITISEFNKGTGDKFCVQGNLDVEILKLSNNKIEEEVIKILSNINNTTGHIFNLGTGITPDIDPAKLKTLIDVLAKVSPRYTIK